MESMNVQTPLLTAVSKIIDAAEKCHPGTRALYEQGRLHLSVPASGARERFVIETCAPVTPLSGEKYHVYVGFYYEQEYDQMPDPEIVMTDAGFPVRMRQSCFGVHETYALFTHDGKTMINLLSKREILLIARQMARDIRGYGLIQEAKAGKAHIKDTQGEE